jgi:hypothetical protein
MVEGKKPSDVILRLMGNMNRENQELKDKVSQQELKIEDLREKIDIIMPSGKE